MTQDRLPADYQDDGARYAEFGQDGDESQSANPLLVVHRLLRGRYILAIITAAVLGAAAGAGMYVSITPKYESTGLIRVKPQREYVLYRGVDEPIAQFGAYLDYQAKLVGSQRVLSLAYRSDTWESRPQKQSIPFTEFTDRIQVMHNRGQLIEVAFEDEFRETAQRAVKSVIEAYMEIYGESDAQGEAERLSILEARRSRLVSELRSQSDKMNLIAGQYTPESIDMLHQSKVAEMLRAEEQLTAIDRHLAVHEPMVAGLDKQVDPGGVHLSPEEVAAFDAVTAGLLAQREELQRVLRRLQARFGDNHRQVTQARTDIAVINQSVQDRVDAINNGVVEQQTSPDSLGTGGLANLQQLRATRQALTNQYAQAKTEAEQLGAKKQQIDNVRAAMEQTQTYLKETEQQIERINVETLGGDLITVVNEGDLPLAPTNGKKRLQFAAAAGMGAGGFGVGLFILYGLLDRRLRSFDDAKSTLGKDAFLGLLPRLPEDLSDPQQILVASLSVHEIRAMLQQRFATDEGLVLGVTSATAGAGKTSLTLALGLSFAATGSRTLAIDFDVVGAGLSSRFRRITNRRMAKALVDAGAIDQPQADELVQQAERQWKPLGQLAVDAGLVEPDQLAGMPGFTPRPSPGVVEALDGRPIRECVEVTGIENFSVLSVGEAQISDIGTISRRALRKLIADARANYDTVLFDTGPMLGSLEASIACSEVDEVVMVLSKDEYQKYAQQSVSRLVEIGARVAGLVFNKAEERDIERFSSTSSLSSRMSQPDGSGDAVINLRDAAECPVEYGPIAHATAACLPENPNRERRAAS